MKFEITKASVRFSNKEIFDGLRFSFRTGKIVGLFGRNGSGKSTLLKLILGLVQSRTTERQLDDQIVAADQMISKRVASYLPQDRFLPRGMKVRNIIPMYFNDGDILDRIFYAPGIAKIESLRFGKLSEGEKKYVELLMIAHLEHPFMMLDEPFAMVNPKTTELIKALLVSIKQQKGILITDHYYRDVLDISDDNYLLKNGRISCVKGEEGLVSEGYLSDNPRTR